MELKIELHERLRHFLNRYYNNNDSLEKRFFLALSEGMIETRGQTFYLVDEADRKMGEIVIQDRDTDDHQGEHLY